VVAEPLDHPALLQPQGLLAVLVKAAAVVVVQLAPQPTAEQAVTEALLAAEAAVAVEHQAALQLLAVLAATAALATAASTLGKGRGYAFRNH